MGTDYITEFMISIHALREEGDFPDADADAEDEDISIHALREEGDSVSSPIAVLDVLFLSTPSARRATVGKEGKLL